MATPKTKSDVKMRHIEKVDLPLVMECARRSHETFDEDFQMADWPPYMLSEADFLSMIGQYRLTSKGMKDTRARVASALVDGKPTVVGGYVFELNAEGYEIIAFAAHPKSPVDARSAMLDDLIDRSMKSEDRKKLSVNVPDSDYVTLKVLMNKGWRLRTPDQFERVPQL